MNEEHIKNFLLETDIINLEELKVINDVSFEKKISFSESLIFSNILDKKSLAEISSSILGIEKVELKNKNILEENFNLIPLSICKEENILVFDQDEKNILIAFFNFSSLELIERIFSENKKKINIFYCEKNIILEKIEELENIFSENFLIAAKKNSEKILKIDDWGIFSEEDLPENFKDDVANDTYTEKFIFSLLGHAVISKVEFIYFNLSEEKVKIYFRIFERNYEIMEIEKKIWLSILLKFKKISDVNISDSFLIKESSFRKKFFEEIFDFFLTFTSTDFGESLTIQVGKEKYFKTDLPFLSEGQRELFLSGQKKDSGLLFLNGKRNSGKKTSLNSFLEFDVQKNKDIYVLENEITEPLPLTKQINISGIKNIALILPKILKNKPDVLSLEIISPGIFPTLFNYITTSKKIILNNSSDIGNFLELLLKMDFDKGQIIKNLSIFIKHEKFKKLSNPKKYFLNKEEIKKISSYLKIENLSKKEFYTEGKEGIFSKKISKLILKQKLA